jgi:hypothetical protein
VPLLDEDYLILSTIHSAKGQEWRSVFVLNTVDGCIPSDLGVGTSDEIEEERRLLYVAMTARRTASTSSCRSASSRMANPRPATAMSMPRGRGSFRLALVELFEGLCRAMAGEGRPESIELRCELPGRGRSASMSARTAMRGMWRK